MTAQDYIKQTGDPTDIEKIQAAIDYLAVFQKNRYDAYLSYSDVQGYTGFIAEGRARSASAYYNQYLEITQAINYYENKIKGITTPLPVFDNTVVRGELYKDGILYQSGDFVQGDIDKLSAIGNYSFIQTDNPSTDTSIPKNPADPYAGGYDPVTLQGLPFKNDSSGKIYTYPDGSEAVEVDNEDGSSTIIYPDGKTYTKVDLNESLNIVDGIHTEQTKEEANPQIQNRFEDSNYQIPTSNKSQNSGLGILLMLVALGGS